MSLIEENQVASVAGHGLFRELDRDDLTFDLGDPSVDGDISMDPDVPQELRLVGHDVADGEGGGHSRTMPASVQNCLIRWVLGTPIAPRARIALWAAMLS